jgi:23S rRNA (uridine2552-2'-O)-methyltransferase
MAHARPKNSRDWVKRHLSDPFVKRSQEEGFRSRSVYKLTEIDAHAGLIKPGMTIVDLGSAPGGWSQWAVKKVGPKGKVVAIDLLEMAPIQDVHFIQADFSHDAGLAAVIAAIGGEQAKVDLVISDMAPNLTGIVITDQARLFTLGEMAMEFAVKFLKPNGVFRSRASGRMEPLCCCDNISKASRRKSRMRRATKVAKPTCWPVN